MTERVMLQRVAAAGLTWLGDRAARSHGVEVSFHDRAGGASDPPFDTLNLAYSVGDDRSHVGDNRTRVASAAGWDVSALALGKQVHGADVIEVSEGRAAPVGYADVLVARVPGVVIGILSADCVPVALAGWRGLVAGAVEAAVDAVGPVRAAWVGPSIHACCYEVSDDVVSAFRATGLPVASADRVDPGRAAEHALRRAGVHDVTTTDECTSCDPRYFSYRRDGLTGRQGSFIRLLDGTR
jgi:YfiH family protein